MPQSINPTELSAVQSEEMQEVVGQPPKGLVRWGTSVFIGVLFLILGVSFFVKYADVLNGEFTLSASNAPKSVLARVDGKLQQLFVSEKDSVRQGQVLAYIESNASHGEVIRLSEELSALWSDIQRNDWERIVHHNLSTYRKLGELQSSYQLFIASYIQLQSFLKNGAHVQQKKLLNYELTNLNHLQSNLQAQEKLVRQDYDIASQDFSIKKRLYDEKVIPLLEYKQEESKYLNKQFPIENITGSIINNNTTIASKAQELIQLEQQFSDQKSNFLQSLNTLISNTDEWKTKYLLTAAVGGTVTFPTLLQEKQDIKTGQELFYISPPGTGYYGEILLSQENFGKLELGQPVLISLASFPYQEFGKLTGRVSFISDFPNKDKKYYVGVSLENGLETNLKYKIHYKNGLVGNSEIVTNKTRLLNKFLFTMREIINRPSKRNRSTETEIAGQSSTEPD